MSIFQNWAIGPAGGGMSWSSYWTTRTPSALVLTALSPTSLRAAWTNAGLGFDGHSVEISTDGTNFTEANTVLFGTNTLDITGLNSGTLYYVRVRAYKGVEYSPYCNLESEETIYLPTDITNLIAWYDPSQIVGLNDNDEVASFTDFSGNNRHLTQSTSDFRPLYKTNIINGNPVVRSDGSNDWMRVLSISIDQPITVYSVLAKTGGAGVDVSDLSNTTKMTVNTTTRISINNGALLQIDTTPAATNIPFIFTAVSNGVNSLISYNGGGPTVTGNSGTNNGNRINLFSESTNSFFSAQDQADYIVYSGAHDATTRRRIETYLALKYDIELEPI